MHVSLIKDDRTSDLADMFNYFFCQRNVFKDARHSRGNHAISKHAIKHRIHFHFKFIAEWMNEKKYLTDLGNQQKRTWKKNKKTLFIKQ